MRALLVLVCLGLALGCAPPDGACADAVGARVDGPELTRALLSDPSLPLDVRLRAARSLMRAARRDVYAPTELGEMIRARPEADRAALAEGLLEAIDEGLASESLSAGTRAKDLLVELAPALDPEAATVRLAAWFARGPERFAGVHSAAAIYAGRPPESLARMLDAIESPTLPRHVVALLTTLSGAPALRAIVASRLLASEAQSHTDAFEEWLEMRLSEALEADGEDPDPLRMQRAMMLNRDRLRLEALEALGAVSDVPTVRARLVERVDDPTLDETVRRAAIAALAEQLTEEEARGLLERALDRHESRAVRRAAAEAVSGVAAMAEPTFLAAAAADDVVRYELLSGALRQDPERFAERLLAEGLPPPPHRLEGLQGLGKAMEGRLSAATLDRLRAASDPYLVIVAVAGGAVAAGLVYDRRAVELAPPVYVHSLGRALTWRPDELGSGGSDLAATEVERMLLEALSGDPDIFGDVLAGE